MYELTEDTLIFAPRGLSQLFQEGDALIQIEHDFFRLQQLRGQTRLRAY